MISTEWHTFFWQVTLSSCGMEENDLDKLVGFSFFPCLWEWNIPHNIEDRKTPCVADRGVWGTVSTNLGVVGKSPWGLAKSLLWTQPMTRGCIFSHAFPKSLLHTVATSLLEKAQAVSKGCWSVAVAGSWGPAHRCWTTPVALNLFPD